MDEDTRERERKKRKRLSQGSSGSREEIPERKFVVGIRAKSKIDGIFKDQHSVAKAIGGKVGEVKAIRTTRSGIVVVECLSEEQMFKALNIRKYDGHRVESFEMGSGGHMVGVIGGVPLSMDPEVFMDVVGVEKARRLKRYREGKLEPSLSICLTFTGDLPERVFSECVTYRVRPYEKGPLRCFSCQEYGHAAAVCRGVRKCGKCGETNCEENCDAQEKEPVCVHCKGNHYAGAASCPRGIK